MPYGFKQALCLLKSCCRNDSNSTWLHLCRTKLLFLTRNQGLEASLVEMLWMLDISDRLSQLPCYRSAGMYQVLLCKIVQWSNKQQLHPLGLCFHLPGLYFFLVWSCQAISYSDSCREYDDKKELKIYFLLRRSHSQYWSLNNLSTQDCTICIHGPPAGYSFNLKSHFHEWVGQLGGWVSLDIN